MSRGLKEANVTFTGTRPVLFDRYTGSNEAKPDPIEQVYWHNDILVMPQINLFAGLTAENTKSVAKMHFGKKAKPIGMAINIGLAIDKQYIPITKDGKEIHHSDFDKHFEVVHHVARINKNGTAIPNPKSRPMLSTPWEMNFGLSFQPNGEVTWEVLKQCFEHLAVMGIGTYRFLYGGFQVEFQDK